MNILEEANKIVNERSQEKDRQYGPFDESIIRTAKIASLISHKEITSIDVFNILISLKLSRESNSHKEDNLLDAVAYIGAMNNYINNKK